MGFSNQSINDIMNSINQSISFYFYLGLSRNFSSIVVKIRSIEKRATVESQFTIPFELKHSNQEYIFRYLGSLSTIKNPIFQSPVNLCHSNQWAVRLDVRLCPAATWSNAGHDAAAAVANDTRHHNRSHHSWQLRLNVIRWTRLFVSCNINYWNCRVLEISNRRLI